MAGGVLKGFGLLFIVLGGLAVVVGLVGAAFGAYVANEEDHRGFFADRDKAEGGVLLGMGGLALAGVGLVVLLLGLLLYAIGASLARRELMQALAARPAAVPVALAPPDPPAAPPVQAVSTPVSRPVSKPSKAGGVDGRVVGLVLALVLGVLLAFLLFQPGGPGAGLVGGGDPPAVQSQTFEGTYQNFRTPVGVSYTGDPQHEMRLARSGPYVVRASLNWTAAPGAQTLSITLEGQEESSGDWFVLAQGEGGPGLTVESTPFTIQNLVRARVSFGDIGGAGSVRYELTLTAIPAR